MTDEEKTGLGIAFNEAQLLDCEIDAATRTATATLSVLTLPAVEDPRVQVVLSNVGRAVALLLNSRWDDASAPAVAFPPEVLPAQIAAFRDHSIYGWEFFDVHEERLAQWHDRYSFDVSLSTTDGRSHTLSLFQDERERTLGFVIWFDDIHLRDAKGNELAIADVIAGGERWWDALSAGDASTAGHGIYQRTE